MGVGSSDVSGVGPLLLDEARQQMLNAPLPSWGEALLAEGDALLIFSQSLAFHNAEFRKSFQLDLSSMGSIFLTLEKTCEWHA